jgi:hypothetical protein
MTANKEMRNLWKLRSGRLLACRYWRLVNCDSLIDPNITPIFFFQIQSNPIQTPQSNAS